MNGADDIHDKTSNLLAELRKITRFPVVLSYDFSCIRSMLRKLGWASSRKKEIELNSQNISFDLLGEVNPLKMSNEDFGKVLPIVLILALQDKNGQNIEQILHPYLWPIWDRVDASAFQMYDAIERSVIWSSLEYVFEEVLDLVEDPYWLENKETLEKAFENR